MGDFTAVKKLPLVDKLITHCSECRRGVFEGQNWIWTVKGIVHKECVK